LAVLKILTFLVAGGHENIDSATELFCKAVIVGYLLNCSRLLQALQHIANKEGVGPLIAKHMLVGNIPEGIKYVTCHSCSTVAAFWLYISLSDNLVKNVS